MKSAEEWANEVGETVMVDCFAGDRNANPGEPTITLIKQIQLDAWKQGMSDAKLLLLRDIKDLDANPNWIVETCLSINHTIDWAIEHEEIEEKES